MKIYTHGFLVSLLMVALFTACSRPVAYVQPSVREHFSRALQATPSTDVVAQAPASEAVIDTTRMTGPSQQVTQAIQTLDKVDALVRNDQKLGADKRVQKGLSRARTLLASVSGKTTLNATAGKANVRMNMMHRLMVKKLNRTISKQLAPENPNEPMAIKGILALGAVVLIAGLLLLLLTTGTGATIGVIGVIAGLALLLIGLI